jgi:glycine/D-amino acid oxidase-like deaminating enzyme/nitrite reductase/ring-hydroxylating ferredoxin subunit
METQTDGKTTSLWAATVQMPACPQLNENLDVDVCVVGAGLGGLTAAYLLQKEGKKVCVLEALEIGGGQTGRTTAHFVTALDDRYFDLEKYHGQEGARLAAESHQASLEKVEAIVRSEKIDCDFKRVDGYLFRSPESESDVLEKELEAAHRCGLKDLHIKEVTTPNAFMKGKALCFPNQIQLHPLKYLKALAEIFLRGGGKIYTQTHASKIVGGSEASVTTDQKFKVTARSIIVATNSPVNDMFAIHTKQAPYRSYVLGFKVSKGTVDTALYWDTQDPYHYVRLHDGDSASDILIVGGEDHKTGQEEHPEKCFQNLETWTRKVFPASGEIVYKWSGQVMEPVDGLGYLGHNPLDKNNVYIITGDSGNGMTHCTIGGMLITDQIMKRPNAWEKLYHPSRISPRASAEFMKENANVAAQYADWFKPLGKKDDLASLKSGEGCVIRDGVSVIAASKSQSGEIQQVSAVCTHLGGIVHWNSVEKSWDCPCHGSRFATDGKVIEGPAITGLAKIEK